MTLDSTAQDLQVWRERASALGGLVLRLWRNGDLDRRSASELQGLLGDEPGYHQPRLVAFDPQRAQAVTDVAVLQLLDLAPELSAGRDARQWVRPALLAAVVAFLALVVAFPFATLVTAMAASTAVYLSALCYRMWLFRHSFDSDSAHTISDAEALALKDSELPLYTVLIPAYKEPTVIAEVVHRLAALDYPHDKLEILLLLEEDDTETVEAALAIRTTVPVQVVLVPESQPRTKPKACNVGLQVSQGEYVVIYDAEDRPEPLQLRRAVAAFRKLGPSYACLQARLDYFNGRQNIITRWFEAEYLVWFRHLLPGVVATGGTVPLGGTSNHLRRTALDVVGGWDPHNVTEDADLGIRLHRLGYEIGVLDSFTEEEANSDFVNWAKQRSRWYKGYLQTSAVHLRHPVTLYRELGRRGFLGFVMLVTGTPVLALLNPLFWSLSVLYVITASGAIAALFPPAVYYPALACWLLGNTSIIYTSFLTARFADRPHLVLSSLLSPVYWLMMSVAAVKAAVQLVQDPSYWEKTTHGLTLAPPVQEVPRAA